MQGLDLFEAALDPQLVGLALQNARGWYADGAFHRTNAGWEEAIVRASQPVLIRDFGGPIGDSIIAMLG